MYEILHRTAETNLAICYSDTDDRIWVREDIEFE